MGLVSFQQIIFCVLGRWSYCLQKTASKKKICSLQPTTDPLSLWPVAMLFHLPCWYRGLHAGRLQLGSQSFSIYQRLPHTHTPFSSWLYSLPSPASIQRHSNSRPPSAPTCSLPPHISSSFYLHRSYLKHTIKKNNRDIVTVDAFKSERQIVLYYYLDLWHEWSPGRVENIDRVSLKAFSRLHWQSLSWPLIVRLVALAGTQEETLSNFTVAFNHSQSRQWINKSTAVMLL